jgi:hypothetical protein
MGNFFTSWWVFVRRSHLCGYWVCLRVSNSHHGVLLNLHFKNLVLPL